LIARLYYYFALSFDEIFKRLSQPSTNINVKDLVDQLKSATGQELESKVMELGFSLNNNGSPNKEETART
jgi:hypothetical protein